MWRDRTFGSPCSHLWVPASHAETTFMFWWIQKLPKLSSPSVFRLFIFGSSLPVPVTFYLELCLTYKRTLVSTYREHHLLHACNKCSLRASSSFFDELQLVVRIRHKVFMAMNLVTKIRAGLLFLLLEFECSWVVRPRRSIRPLRSVRSIDMLL